MVIVQIHCTQVEKTRKYILFFLEYFLFNDIPLIILLIVIHQRYGPARTIEAARKEVGKLVTSPNGGSAVKQKKGKKKNKKLDSSG